MKFIEKIFFIKSLFMLNKKIESELPKKQELFIWFISCNNFFSLSILLLSLKWFWTIFILLFEGVNTVSKEKLELLLTWVKVFMVLDGIKNDELNCSLCVPLPGEKFNKLLLVESSFWLNASSLWEKSISELVAIELEWESLRFIFSVSILALLNCSLFGGENKL